MANNFTRYPAKSVGTTAVSLFTVGADTQTTLIGLTLANTSNAPITVSAFITIDGIDYYIVPNATVPVGSTLVPIGGEQKNVLITGDTLKVVSSTASSMDAIASVLNIT